MDEKKELGFTLEEIDSFRLSLASPERIRLWSSGEVKKPETINYKSFKPEADGLFCQKIFGPEKDYECACGKYKQQKYKGRTCEKCGVEIIESSTRRHRMGHIELAEPIAHIWYFKVTPYYLAFILNVNSKDLRSVIYLAAHIVIDPGEIGEFITQNQIVEPEKSRGDFIKIIQWIIDNKVKAGSFAEEEGKDLLEELQQVYKAFNFAEITDYIEEHTGARYGSGALAISEILKKMDLEKEAADIRAELDIIIKKGEKTGKEVLSSQRAKKLLKRVEVVDAFIKNQTKPEWTIMSTIPVLPPDLRPLIPLAGGRFTSSDVNDLYRSVIIRNEKLKEFLDKPYTDEIILNNARRLLQDSVDTLFDNSRRDKPKMAKDKKRAVKSLADTIKGKQGRFRQNLLGKRVDYSGRSVIVVGPDLKMDQCGLPVNMALKLFEPFISAKLVQAGLAQNAKAAQILIEERSDKIWNSVELALAERPVLLNRAPTLHRLSVQAFYPKMIQGKTIRLHPLATPAFNADFDGDQMAVHVPVTDEAVYEAKTLLLGSKNILGLKDGKPIVTPSQDMVLGNYYLTLVKKGVNGESAVFANIAETKRAYELGHVDLHAIIALPTSAHAGKFANLVGTEKENGYVITTVGKAIFNEATPEEFHWINEPSTKNVENALDYYVVKKGTDVRKFIADLKAENEWTNFFNPFKKGILGKVIFEVFTQIDKDPLLPEKTVILCDNLKKLGFDFATKAGITVSIDDVKVDKGKYKLFEVAEKKVRAYEDFHNQGLLTKEEKSRLVIEIWTDVKSEVQEMAKVILESNKENPIYMMSDSGARGNISNFTQLAGMRGLMAAPKIQVDKGVREGKVIETPVKSSFIEGLSTSEFFISTHGARKGLTDTALNTGVSGYFTRKLVDVAIDIIVKEEDCGSKRTYTVEPIRDTRDNAVIIPLKDRIIGRTCAKTYKDADGNQIVKKGQLISRDMADKINEANIEAIEIRSVFTCDTRDGVCQKCYGTDLATNQLVKQAEAVGVIAAQSVGEPGTQLTMRTFHTGGVAGGASLTDGFPAVVRLMDTVRTNSVVNFSEYDGEVTNIESDSEEGYKITIKHSAGEKVYNAKSNPMLRVSVGDKVVKGQKTYEGRTDLRKLLEATGNRMDVWNYMLKELHKIYKTNAGVTISDKYFEIILKKLTSFEEVINPGGTDLLPNHIITTTQLLEANEKAAAEGKEPARTKAYLEGAKSVPKRSPSFLVGASFSHAITLLVKATIFQQVDPLKGVNENILLGRKIPAGTGILGVPEDQLLRNNRPEQQLHQPLEEVDGDIVATEPVEGFALEETEALE